MYSILLLFCLGLAGSDAVDLSKARHLLRRRQTFDPKTIPAQSFNPGDYRADSFNPNSYTAQTYDPSAPNNPKYDQGKTGLTQITRQNPNNFQAGAIGDGKTGSYNYNPSSFLNPSSQLTNGKAVSVGSASGGSSSYTSSYNPGVNANSNFDPNAINSLGQTGNNGGNSNFDPNGVNSLGQTGSKGQSQTGSISQTGGSFIPGGSGGQTGGGYDPSRVNGMLSGSPSQSGASLSQTGSMNSATNFNPNSLSSMTATQTG